MGRVININGKDCVPDGVILDNLKEMIDDGMSVDEILELRFPSFLPHRRVEDVYQAAKEHLDPFRYPNDT
tara:strand:- start:169 stop:378 length:210 start_codon:yes stop_codon:yes gene_type:complete